MKEPTTDTPIVYTWPQQLLRIAAQLISALFHPLLIPSYMLLMLVIVNPYLFGVSSLNEQHVQILLFRVFVSTFFIPLFSIMMLRFTGLLSNLAMLDSKDRIAPYIITGIFYLWLFRNFYGNPTIPAAYTVFMLGATIALFLAFFINIFSRISVHTVGMGVLVGMVLITMWQFSYDTFMLGTWSLDMNIILIFVILVAGMVGTARQLLHPIIPTDLYGGYAVGVLAQFIALRFII
jgi:hypothetical protein